MSRAILCVASPVPCSGGVSRQEELPPPLAADDPVGRDRISISDPCPYEQVERLGLCLNFFSLFSISHLQWGCRRGQIAIVRKIRWLAAGRIGRAAAEALCAPAAGAGRRATKGARLVEREAGHIARHGGEVESTDWAACRRGRCGSGRSRSRNGRGETGRLDGGRRTGLTNQAHVAHVRQGDGVASAGGRSVFRQKKLLQQLALPAGH